MDRGKLSCVATDDERQRSVLVTAPRRAIGKRVAELRRNRGWNLDDLAQACARLGAPELNRAVIGNIESGRRTFVDVGEWLALSYALDCSPLHVLVPPHPDRSVDEQWISITSDRWFRPAWLRQWVRGRWAPSDVDPRIFYDEVPKEEWEPPEPTPQQIDERSDMVRAHRDLVAQFEPKRAPDEAASAIRDARRAEAYIADNGEVGEEPVRRAVATTEYEVRPGEGEQGWRVLKPGARRISGRASSSAAALKQATDLIRKRGGGRIIEYGTDGKARAIRDVDAAGHVRKRD